MIFSDNHIQYVYTLGGEFQVPKLKIEEIKWYVKLGRSSIYLEPFFKIFNGINIKTGSFKQAATDLIKHFKTRHSPSRQRIS